ncbi:MAG: TIGR00730 family Rossman fold protein, partial [Planctomycetes bacterium]|nr:TIGR00730 family Rossman fold protein [Planctomycetota bacterium]MCC7398391.1 TIGR00730 family Rossman fold protein [Planctomycetota bacterium]
MTDADAVAPARPFRVTVYASSSEHIDPAYMQVAEQLGRRIADRGWDLVWGGGRFGLMGAVSRGARAAGGRTIGVILQQFVDKNVHCEQATEMATVHDMRSRKRGLDESGDAYVALPGGLGTLEELLEILSFKQLGLHRRPVVVLDALGYWQPLLQMLDKGFAEGFIQPQFRGLYVVAADADAAVRCIAEAPPWSPGTIAARGGGTG